jgi:hypothetical protein
MVPYLQGLYLTIVHGRDNEGWLDQEAIKKIKRRGLDKEILDAFEDPMCNVCWSYLNKRPL